MFKLFLFFILHSALIVKRLATNWFPMSSLPFYQAHILIFNPALLLISVPFILPWDGCSETWFIIRKYEHQFPQRRSYAGKSWKLCTFIMQCLMLIFTKKCLCEKKIASNKRDKDAISDIEGGGGKLGAMTMKINRREI